MTEWWVEKEIYLDVRFFHGPIQMFEHERGVGTVLRISVEWRQGKCFDNFYFKTSIKHDSHCGLHGASIHNHKKYAVLPFVNVQRQSLVSREILSHTVLRDRSLQNTCIPPKSPSQCCCQSCPDSSSSVTVAVPANNRCETNICQTHTHLNSTTISSDSGSYMPIWLQCLIIVQGKLTMISHAYFIR